MAKNSKTVRNEQEAQLKASTAQQPKAGKPDDLHNIIIDMTKDQEYQQGLADRMLTQAKSYCDEAGVLDTKAFSDDCALQEAWITSDAAAKEGVKTNRIPRTWTIRKSEILRAVKPASENGTGKSLTEFGTFHELRKALPRKPRQPKAESAATVQTVAVDPSTGGRLTTLANVSLMLNPEGVDILNEALDDLITEMKAHAKAHPKAKEAVSGSSKEETLMPEDEIENVDLTPEEQAELRTRLQH